MIHSFIWLILIGIFILIEIITMRLVAIWFAGGAVIAFFLSLYVDQLLLEFVVFFVISAAFLFFTRPLLMQYVRPRKIRTNYEGVIGKKAIVIRTIDNRISNGQVNVDGQEWSAKSADGSTIKIGEEVMVKEISGTKLLVYRKLSNRNDSNNLS